VLLVEDEPWVRDLARQWLQRSGYRVHEAVDGRAAKELVSRENLRVDLLVTDVVMPKVHGLELADWLCRRDPSVRVLLISGYPDHAIVRDGALDPRADFLQKPFTLQELTLKVRAVLDRPAVGAETEQEKCPST
jgi:DNA-binding response OmpR family regulator